MEVWIDVVEGKGYTAYSTQYLSSDTRSPEFTQIQPLLGHTGSHGGKFSFDVLLLSQAHCLIQPRKSVVQKVNGAYRWRSIASAHLNGSISRGFSRFRGNICRVVGGSSIAGESIRVAVFLVISN